MVDETQGSGAASVPSGGPVVEDNGPWFVVFITVFIFLFASAFAFLVHSLLVTFGTGVAGAEMAAVSPVETEAEAEDAAPSMVELTAVGLQFEGPDTVPAGWTTLRLNNESEFVHFAWIMRHPEGRGVAEHQSELAPVFQEGMDLLNAGEQDAALEKFGEVPEWFGDMETLGGPGFVAGGRSAEAVLRLEPGTYVIECYVKTDGVFHSAPAGPDSYGMVHELTVTGDGESGETTGAPPEPTIEVWISSDDGITVDAAGSDPADPAAADSEAAEAVPAGEHTVAVDFVDQTRHENFAGHDVHVARIAGDTDVEALAVWMDWRAPGGLETAAPAEFIGGINELSAGETGYFNLTLEPGEYVWISEVPNPAEKGMLRRFTVE